MSSKKFLLPMDYGANEESTFNMDTKQPSPMNPALRHKMSKRIASFNWDGLGSSREYVAELVKQYDLIALQETWLVPWDLAVHPHY